MKARIRGAFAVAAALPLLAAWARAGNLDATLGSYGATLGAGAAVAAERSAFGQNPAALRPGSAGAGFGFHRPYGLGDLGVAEAGAYLDGARAGLACGWRATEIEGVYSEQGFRVAPSARLARDSGFPGELDVGAGLTAWRTAIGGRDVEWDAAAEAGLAWRFFPRLKAGLFAAGLSPRRPDAEAGRVLQAGLSADSRAARGESPGQTVRLDFRKTGAAPWRILASLTARPVPGWEASVGASARPFRISAGLGLAWRGFRVRQAVRYHRYLGRTWLPGLGFERPGKGS